MNNQEPITLRPSVLWFARQMEAKLRENDHKGGWEQDEAPALLHRVQQELDELHQALYGGTPDQRIAEAADVANMAMMVATLQDETLAGYENGYPPEDVRDYSFNGGSGYV